MARYLFHGTHAPQALRSLLGEGGSAALERAQRTLQSVGGSLVSFYYAFGHEDFFIVVDLPDNVSARAVTMAGNIAGGFRNKALALLGAEHTDATVKKGMEFRPPGH